MTVPTPVAFSPGSVTCFFVPALGSAPGATTSAGCGINLSLGVTAAVRPAGSHVIRFNGQVMDFAPVRRVLEALAPEAVEVFLESPLPLGCGFGVSAAGAMTTAFALARRFSLDKQPLDLAHIALHAEIQERTGIGDVPTQFTGGVVLRRWQQGPFDCVQLPILPATLYFRAFGPLSTKSILSDPNQVRILAREGRLALAWLEAQKTLTLADLLERSLAFARHTGQLADPRLTAAIDGVVGHGGRATMVMLGLSVLASQPGPEPACWTQCSIDTQGTRWLP